MRMEKTGQSVFGRASGGIVGKSAMSELSEGMGQANARALGALGRSPFPHLSMLDTAVWKRFLRTDEAVPWSWRYDMRLGHGSFGQRFVDDDLAPAWAALVKKRVDCIGVAGGDVVIVEVKPIGGMSALGQVLTYWELFKAKGKPTASVTPWVVCGRADEDVISVYEVYGVRLSVV